jgi:uncharacterized membrane protein
VTPGQVAGETERTLALRILLLVVLGFIVSSFVALLTGNDVSQWLDLIL